MADVRVAEHGTIWMVTPLNDETLDWVRDHVELEGWQWLGPSFGIEWRYIDELVQGMTDAGLEIELG